MPRAKRCALAARSEWWKRSRGPCHSSFGRPSLMSTTVGRYARLGTRSRSSIKSVTMSSAAPIGVMPFACMFVHCTCAAGANGRCNSAVPPNVTTAMWISACASSSSANAACISATAELSAAILPSAAMLPLTSAMRTTGSGRADATVNSLIVAMCRSPLQLPTPMARFRRRAPSILRWCGRNPRKSRFLYAVMTTAPSGVQTTWVPS